MRKEKKCIGMKKSANVYPVKGIEAKSRLLPNGINSKNFTKKFLNPDWFLAHKL
jgi:hypothetical protein